MLFAEDRDDLGVEIQGNRFQLPGSFADKTQQLEVDLCYMLWALWTRNIGKET